MMSTLSNGTNYFYKFNSKMALHINPIKAKLLKMKALPILTQKNNEPSMASIIVTPVKSKIYTKTVSRNHIKENQGKENSFLEDTPTRSLSQAQSRKNKNLQSRNIKQKDSINFYRNEIKRRQLKQSVQMLEVCEQKQGEIDQLEKGLRKLMLREQELDQDIACFDDFNGLLNFPSFQLKIILRIMQGALVQRSADSINLNYDSSSELRTEEPRSSSSTDSFLLDETSSLK